MDSRNEVVYKCRPTSEFSYMIVKKNVGKKREANCTIFYDETVQNNTDITYYFFDINGIYRKSVNDDRGLWTPRMNKSFDKGWTVPTYQLLEPPYNNARRLCQMVLCAYMKPGMTVKDFEDLLNRHKYDIYGAGYSKEPIYVGIERDVTKVERPIYRNANGNTKKAFDYILVDMNLRTGIENKREFIINNKRALIQKAVDRIKEDRSFQKYNVPIGVLKLSKIIRIEEATIEFIFELKDELRHMES